jgi:peptide/nickel transport system substrate-binding protein
MRTSVRRVVTALVLVGAVMVGGCGDVSRDGAGAAGEGDSDGVVRVALTEDIDNLMVGKLHTLGDRFIAINLYDGLLRYVPGTTELEPALAETYEISEDGLTWTFHLRDGVEFSGDYGEVTSRDVKASFEYQMDEANATYDRALFSAIESIDTPDDATVVLNLSTPNPSMLYSVIAWQPGYITSADALDEVGPDGLANAPVGTGPYAVEETLRAQGTTLSANAGYYDGEPSNGGIEFQIIPDQRVAVETVSQGDIDIAPVSQSASSQALEEAVAEGSAVSVEAEVSSWNDFLYFNTASGPTSDVKVRQAIAHSIDLEALADALGSISSVNPSYFSKAVPEWTGDVPIYEPDLAKAASLLADAGYSEPSEVELTLAYSKANLYEDLTLRIADMIRETGITVNVVPVPREQQADYARADEWNLLVWAAGRVSPDDYATNFTRSTGSSNYPKWNDPDADALIDAAKSEPDPQRRAQLYADLQVLVKEQLPILTLDTMASLFAARPEVDGLVPSAAYAGIATLSGVTVE